MAKHRELMESHIAELVESHRSYMITGEKYDEIVGYLKDKSLPESAHFLVSSPSVIRVHSLFFISLNSSVLLVIKRPCVQYKWSLYLSLLLRYLRKGYFGSLNLDQGQRSLHQIKAHVWFPIGVQYKWSLYLSLFLVYLRKWHFGSLTLDQGQRSFHQIKAHVWFPIGVEYKWSLYLSLFSRY